jgi:succinyl-diaminopimelate desuccinylase
MTSATMFPMQKKVRPVQLLSRLVAMESCDPPGRELEIARCLETELSGRGAEVEIDEFAPGRANLLARWRGGGNCGPLVFSAHLDTLPPGSQGWSVRPFGGSVKGGRLFGRGASDMKSGVAAMTAAFCSIAAEGAKLKGDLVLAYSAGESSNCLGAKRFVERAQFADASAILVSEPSSLDLVIAEMGALWLRVTALGQTGHVSGRRGINAIEAMTDFVTGLRSVGLPCPPHPLLPDPTMQIGVIRGGHAINVTPDQCTIELDVRIRPNTDPQAIIDLVARPGVSIEVVDFKPSVETDVEHLFTKVCLEACRRHRGINPKIAGVSYYSDATIYASAWRTPFAIIGPGELGMSGQPDEYVEIDKVTLAARIFERVARQWLGSAPP